jgi:hypothetical protein
MIDSFDTGRNLGCLGSSAMGLSTLIARWGYSLTGNLAIYYLVDTYGAYYRAVVPYERLSKPALSGGFSSLIGPGLLRPT